MEREEYRKYFEVLELPFEASFQEITKTYNFLKELYSTESIVTVPVEGEFSGECQAEILDQIDEAYEKIQIFFKRENRKREKDVMDAVSTVTEFDGPVFNRIREQMNVDIRDIAIETRIPERHLRNIESEKFSDLPVYVYTRGFVMEYAKFLSLDVEKASSDFMKKYSVWKEESDKQDIP